MVLKKFCGRLLEPFEEKNLIWTYVENELHIFIGPSVALFCVRSRFHFVELFTGFSYQWTGQPSSYRFGASIFFIAGSLVHDGNGCYVSENCPAKSIALADKYWLNKFSSDTSDGRFQLLNRMKILLKFQKFMTVLARWVTHQGRG